MYMYLVYLSIWYSKDLNFFFSNLVHRKLTENQYLVFISNKRRTVYEVHFQQTIIGVFLIIFFILQFLEVLVAHTLCCHNHFNAQAKLRSHSHQINKHILD